MVAIVNFGGQYAHLIARKIRELGVKSELVPPDISKEEILRLSPQAIILSGSPFSCFDPQAPKLDMRIYDIKVPILGICYGQQLMAYQLGGQVTPQKSKQFGKEIVKLEDSLLFAGLAKEEPVWFSHGDQVKKLPESFKVIASTKNAKIAAIENPKRKLYAIQFHAEVTHTPHGQKILSNFLFKIANAQKDWDMEKIKNNILQKIGNQVKNEKVLGAISGGVDSLVASTLVEKVIGPRLYLIFINTGLLRKNEVAEVKDMIKKVNFKNFKIIDAKDRFLKALTHVIDPEEKRQIIAKLYFSILEEEAKKIASVKFLCQGTIYPDRIESAQPSKHADKIKSHHNVTLPKGLALSLVEPLADLYKDEVRKLGRLLKIPDQFLNRHPFPGPGLAIRILGEVTKERLAILKEVDYIFISNLKKAGIYNKVGQAFAALLPVKSVGVMGDSRTYSYIISLRSVDTQDFMTADWSKIPQNLLEKVSSAIVNQVRGVNRVVYDITQKPPATIEYE